MLKHFKNQSKDVGECDGATWEPPNFEDESLDLEDDGAAAFGNGAAGEIFCEMEEASQENNIIAQIAHAEQECHANDLDESLRRSQIDEPLNAELLEAGRSVSNN